MKAQRTRFFFALVLFVSVGTIKSTDAADQMMPSAGIMLSASSSTVDGSMTLERIFNAYLYEKTLCPSLAEIVSRHAALPKELDAEFRKTNTSEDKILSVLLNGTLRDEPEVQYVRNHRDYFEFLIFYHPISGATQVTPSFPLLCLLTEKRILELEAFGPSAQAWEARRDLLNEIRRDLSMPWHEGPTHLPFDTLSIMFDHVKTIFTRSEDIRNLTEWIAETEAFFHQSAENMDPAWYNDWPKEQQLEWKAKQHETLRSWITILRRGL